MIVSPSACKAASLSRARTRAVRFVAFGGLLVASSWRAGGRAGERAEDVCVQSQFPIVIHGRAAALDPNQQRREGKVVQTLLAARR
jgi:hypothetical protein